MQIELVVRSPSALSASEIKGVRAIRCHKTLRDCRTGHIRGYVWSQNV